MITMSPTQRLMLMTDICPHNLHDDDIFFKLLSSTLYLSILSFFGSDSTILVQVISPMYFPIFFVPSCTEAFS